MGSICSQRTGEGTRGGHGHLPKGGRLVLSLVSSLVQRTLPRGSPFLIHLYRQQRHAYPPRTAGDSARRKRKIAED